MAKKILLHAYTGNGYGSAASKLLLLKANGIEAKKQHSCYVGMTAFEIPAKQEKKAEKLLWGA